MQSDPEQPTHLPPIAGAAAARVFKTLMSAPEETPESAPPAIDGYRIVGHAGAGGQGTTWIAEPRESGTPAPRFAIKVLRYSARGFPRQYWAELEALANLRLPCLPRVVDSGITGGHPWIATEYIDGTDLVEFERGRSRAEIVEAIAKTADALASVHDAGYVHRDLKPSNILMRHSDGAAVLIDLGLACRSGTSAVHESVVGTPEFMSAEQARGEPCTAASDQWSLAATAYLMLTGETPHPVLPTVAEQIACARTSLARPARSVAPTLPPAIAAVLDRALSQEVRRRFGSCREFAARLRSAASGQMPPVRDQRHRAIVTVSVVLLVGAVMVLALLRPAVPKLLLEGEYPAISFGEHIAVLGDLDGDGLDEVAVSGTTAPNRAASPWIEAAGEVFVYNGRAIAGEVTAAPHVISGPRLHGKFGVALSAIGDVDGDGTPDLASYLAQPGGIYDSLIVVRGSVNFAKPGQTDLVNHPTVVHEADVYKGPLRSFAGLDLDGDGLTDVVAGEPNRGPNRAGGLLVLHGGREFFTAAPRAERIAAPSGVRGFGTAVSVVRDSGHGEPIVVVGAALGTEESGMRGHVVLLDGTLAVRRTIVGARWVEWFGHSIDAAADGGVLRLAVGASGIARAPDDSGRAYLIEIPFTELAASRGPIDIDAPESKRFLRAFLDAPASSAIGMGDQCGYFVHLTPGGWAVSAPKSDAGGTDSGRMWIGEPGGEHAVEGREGGESFGLGLELWRGRDRTLVLIGAPVADGSRGMRGGAVRVIELER